MGAGILELTIYHNTNKSNCVTVVQLQVDLLVVWVCLIQYILPKKSLLDNCED